MSGDDRKAILELVERARSVLEHSGFRVNNRKTRLMSFRAQQRVTGVVVNEVLRPPRKLQRQVRAGVHNASKREVATSKELARLNGYVSYFSMFPDLADSAEIRSMKSNLNRIAVAEPPKRKRTTR
jgi:RNA-directed DNA polymerase